MNYFFFHILNRRVFVVISALIVLLYGNFDMAQADILGPAPCVETTECSMCAIFAFASKLISFLIKDILPYLAAAMFTIGGVMLIISTGNEQRRRTGISILNSTLIGVLVALGAWVIINTLLINLTKAGGFSAAFWKEATCQQ